MRRPNGRQRRCHHKRLDTGQVTLFKPNNTHRQDLHQAYSETNIVYAWSTMSFQETRPVLHCH